MSFIHSDNLPMLKAIGLRCRGIVFACLTFMSVLTSADRVFAATFSSEEMASFPQAATDFSTAITTNDTAQLAQDIPPNVRKFLAENGNITDDQLIAAVEQSLRKTAETVTTDVFKLDVKQAVAAIAGNGFPYLLVPTEFHMKKVSGGGLLVHAQTLAFVDGGKWYLMSLSDPQKNKLLKIAYPNFRNVDFPKDVAEVVKE